MRMERGWNNAKMRNAEGENAERYARARVSNGGFAGRQSSLASIRGFLPKIDDDEVPLAGFNRFVKPSIVSSLLVSLFAVGNFALAQDRERPAGEIDRLTQQGKEARAAGRNEEADAFIAKAKQLEGEAREEGRERERREREGRNRKAEAQRRQIEELRRAGKHDEAQRIEGDLNDFDRDRDRDRRPLRADGDDRVRHVEEAIKHLHAAGLHEPAERLEGSARAMRERAGNDPHERDNGPRDRRDEGPRDLRGDGPRDLRGDRPREMEGVVRDLHRGMEELRVDLRKLARNIEELREQVKKDRGDKPEAK